MRTLSKTGYYFKSLLIIVRWISESAVSLKLDDFSPQLPTMDCHLAFKNIFLPNIPQVCQTMLGPTIRLATLYCRVHPFDPRSSWVRLRRQANFNRAL